MSPEKAVLAGLTKLYKDKHLLHILDIVRNYKAVDGVLFQSCLWKKKKRRHIDISLRLQGFPEDSLIACLFEELDMLKVFVAQQDLEVYDGSL